MSDVGTQSQQMDLLEAQPGVMLRHRSGEKRGIDWKSELDGWAATNPEVFDRFLVFHNANLWLVDGVVLKARSLMARGVRRYSMRDLLRFTATEALVERGKSSFRVDNNYSRPFALWVMWRYPEFGGFFTAKSQGHTGGYCDGA